MSDEVLRAHARILRNSPLIDRVVSDRRAEIISQWESSHTTTEREAAWAAITALETLREVLDARIRFFAGDGNPDE